MADQNLPVKFAETREVIIPPLGERPEVYLPFNKIFEGESRLYEAQTVNPSTYSELEYTYGEGYREAKTHLAVVGYEIAQTDKMLQKIKSEHIIDHYPEFLKETKVRDSASVRDAFLAKQSDYMEAVERLNALKALEKHMENKVKVFENVSRYMKKQMDILIRSGINPNKY